MQLSLWERPNSPCLEVESPLIHRRLASRAIHFCRHVDLNFMSIEEYIARTGHSGSGSRTEKRWDLGTIGSVAAMPSVYRGRVGG